MPCCLCEGWSMQCSFATSNVPGSFPLAPVEAGAKREGEDQVGEVHGGASCVARVARLGGG